MILKYSDTQNGLQDLHFVVTKKVKRKELESPYTEIYSLMRKKKQNIGQLITAEEGTIFLSIQTLLYKYNTQ